MHVSDEHRTNPLSLRPGGSTVTVIYESGKSFTYDKVKRPTTYIRNISGGDKGPISKILVDNIQVWDKSSSKKPYDF